MEKYLLIGIACVAVLLTISFFVFRRKHSRGGQSQTEYIAGLNCLIAGDQKKALAKFRAAVRRDTECVDAYIKIGDILRNIGAADKATRVHLDLLVRPRLSDDERLNVLKSIVLDYRADKDYDKALTTCEQIRHVARNDPWCQENQLQLYEDKTDWHGAYENLRKNSSIPRETKNPRLACYKVEQGRQQVDNKRERDARLRYREAIKLDQGCVAAYIELVDSYMRERRASDAIPVLKKLIQNKPHFSELAFSRFKQVLFEIGHFGDIEKLYIDLIKTNPEIVEAHLGLAEILEKKGELRRAIDMANRVLSSDPKRLEAKLMLVRLQSKLGRDQSAAEIASELASEVLTHQTRYTCDKCGYRAEHYYWHCPECKAWNSANKDI